MRGNKNVVRPFMLWVMLAFSLTGPLAWGAEFPARSIDLLIPYAPGGPSDTMGRAVGAKLGEILGQTVVAQNKPGAAGAVALALCAKAKADGYTILIASTAALTVVPQFEKVGYNTLGDFTFLSMLYYQSPMVVVRADSPWKTMEEFMDYAKKNPKKIRYGSPGQFSGSHIAMEALGKERGIEWVHIPFKGDGPSVTALLGGHVEAVVSFAGHVPHVRAGKLRGLFTPMSRRSTTFPDLPCFKDITTKVQGKGLTEAVGGIIAPKGLPKEVVKKYEDTFAKIAKSPEYVKACNNLWLDINYLNAADFQKEVEEGYKSVSDLISRIGMK